jgi:hypothetical protein
MNQQIQDITYPDLTTVRTNKPLIFDPFKDLVKKQGLDICFVTNNFWKAYVEAAQFGKVEMPTQPQTTQGTQTIHYHTHLHLQTNYVVDKPRRRRAIQDIPYICEAKGCTKTATTILSHKNGKTYSLCDTHTQQYQPHATTVEPLIKVYKSNTIHEQKTNKIKMWLKKLRNLFK